MNPLMINAAEYCNRNSSELIVYPLLGSGTDGTVWRTQKKTAVKAFELPGNFVNEYECYQRLFDANIIDLNGFAVPTLEGYDHGLMVIEMTIVQPPYLLDFGKVYIDRPPPYWNDDEVMSQWHKKLTDDFGDDVDEVYLLLEHLRQKFRIYYVDPKPKNIAVHPF